MKERVLITKPVVSEIKCKKYLKTHQKEKKKPVGKNWRDQSVLSSVLIRLFEPIPVTKRCPSPTCCVI